MPKPIWSLYSNFTKEKSQKNENLSQSCQNLVQFENFQYWVICFDQIDTTGAKIKLNDS